MKKLLFTLLLAAMVLPSWAYDFYIVGTAAEGWKESGRSDAYKMTNKDGVFVWTGFLNAGLFKLCKDDTWNRWCALWDEKTPAFGEDETITYHESGDNNNNWKFKPFALVHCQDIYGILFPTAFNFIFYFLIFI